MRRLVRTAAVVAVAIAGLVLLLRGPETATSYCHDIYDHGNTPQWATFSDYPSCVSWYDATRANLSR